MRIGVVSCSGIYPVHSGGPASVGYFLAREFGRDGHEVTLFVRPKNERELAEIKREIANDGMENVRLDLTTIDYRPKTFLNFPYLIWRILKFSVRFSRTPFDVVLFNSPPVDIALLTPIISRLKNTKQVIIFHGYGGIFEGKYPFGSFIVALERRFYDKAIIHSEASRKIPQRLGFPLAKVTQIPNGLDVEMVSKAEPIDLKGSPRVLFVGLLTREKGVDTLIEAFSELKNEFPEARLYIVGDGPERKRLESISARLGLKDDVCFEGHISPKELFSYYKSVDIFVLPSIREGFGIVLLEAMAACLPIVASRVVGSANELVRHSQNGRLFSPGNAKELAVCMKDILRERGKKESEYLKNRELVSRRYGWNGISKEYLSLFEEIMP